jgi:hypothetical protein
MRRVFSLLGSVLVLSAFAVLTLHADDDEEGWVQIWDGQTFEGWKASENKDSWKIEDGAIVCHGPRSHLFYVADDEPFVNFELKADVMTKPGSNSGIYFHTRFQEEGWPKYGHEAQVNITHEDPKKTGSLYGIVNVSDPPAKDDEYWTQHIIVQDHHITIKVNDEVVVDYEEPKDQKAFSEEFERRLGKGTFALQAHDPESTVYFKNIRVKRLP